MLREAKLKKNCKKIVEGTLERRNDQIGGGERFRPGKEGAELAGISFQKGREAAENA